MRMPGEQDGAEVTLQKLNQKLQEKDGQIGMLINNNDKLSLLLEEKNKQLETSQGSPSTERHDIPMD